LSSTNSETKPPPGGPLEPTALRTASDVGRIVRRRRRDQSLRIDDAAALTGVSVDLYSRLENGKGAVRLDKLLAVLDGLGLALVVGAKDDLRMQRLLRPADPDADQDE
jgi:transcriptional regulator with XRE-family HTH domain